MIALIALTLTGCTPVSNDPQQNPAPSVVPVTRVIQQPTVAEPSETPPVQAPEDKKVADPSPVTQQVSEPASTKDTLPSNQPTPFSKVAVDSPTTNDVPPTNPENQNKTYDPTGGLPKQPCGDFCVGIDSASSTPETPVKPEPQTTPCGDFCFTNILN